MQVLTTTRCDEDIPIQCVGRQDPRHLVQASFRITVYWAQAGPFNSMRILVGFCGPYCVRARYFLP